MTPTFRQWILILWQEHCRELDAYGEHPITPAQYFQKYRWWLRREYRHRHEA